MMKKAIEKKINQKVTLGIKEALGLNQKDKIKIEVPFCKAEDFVEGFKFVFNDRKFGEFGINGKIATVTYRRCNVVFFIVSGKKKEQFFELKSLFAEHLEPFEYVALQSKEHYEYVSRYKKTKIKYA